MLRLFYARTKGRHIGREQSFTFSRKSHTLQNFFDTPIKQHVLVTGFSMWHVVRPRPEAKSPLMQWMEQNRSQNADAALSNMCWEHARDMAGTDNYSISWQVGGPADAQPPTSVRCLLSSFGCTCDKSVMKGRKLALKEEHPLDF